MQLCMWPEDNTAELGSILPFSRGFQGLNAGNKLTLQVLLAAGPSLQSLPYCNFDRSIDKSLGSKT